MPVQVNAHPALLLCLDGEVDGIVTVRVEGGLISGLYYLRNPEKLTAVRRTTTRQRWWAERNEIHQH